MAISRKHFNALAGIVNDHRKRWSGHDDECQHVQHLAYRLADYLWLENPGFDSDRFIEACGFHWVDGEGWRERTHRDR